MNALGKDSDDMLSDVRIFSIDCGNFKYQDFRILFIVGLNVSFCYLDVE